MKNNVEELSSGLLRDWINSSISALKIQPRKSGGTKKIIFFGPSLKKRAKHAILRNPYISGDGAMKFGERVNLHTHTARCGHASGTIEAYCREAEKQGLAVLGFSDHAPFPDERFAESRMEFAELAAYLADIERMRGEFPNLELLTGAEVDYMPSAGRAFYEETYSPENGFDYLIAGPHFTEPSLEAYRVLSAAQAQKYAEAAIYAMESGLFAYVAHPDMFTARCPRWNPELAAIAADLAEASKAFGVPLEINAYGLRKPWIDTEDGHRPQYPFRPFWEVMAEHGVRMVVGADAHRPRDVWGNTDDAIAFGADLGLAPENREVAAKIIRRKRER